MFIAEELAYELVKELRPHVDAIQKRDRDLAQQARRAASSIALNLAEGSQRQGKDRLHHYRIAGGSAAELKAALRLASAWGYVDERGFGATISLVKRVLYMIWRLTTAAA